MSIDTRCKHERENISTGRTVSDYQPLSKDEIASLLLTASTADHRLANQIQIRLTQGIRGILCPRQIDGEVARRSAELESLYVETLENEPSELPKSSMVERFYKLMEPGQE